jgi:hypothetical protein
MSSEADTKPSDVEIPKTSITIYGGKKEDMRKSITDALNLSADDYYSTWISLGLMNRLGFLFEGGVESAGGLAGLIVMFIVLIAALTLFALWQIAVVFIVIAVLVLLSGGAALKFLRATYITKPMSEMDSLKVEQFVMTQVSQGRFVRLESVKTSDGMSRATLQVSTATLIFRRGIQFSLFVATLFLIIEIAYFFIVGHWLSGLNPTAGPMEALVLLNFGLYFLCGVILMDFGVLLRSRVEKSLQTTTEE